MFFFSLSFGVCKVPELELKEFVCNFAINEFTIIALKARGMPISVLEFIVTILVNHSAILSSFLKIETNSFIFFCQNRTSVVRIKVKHKKV